MFVDEVILKVEAGKGGDGCTSFRREKYIPLGGPNGGNGGKGSDIIFKVDEGLHTLLDLRYQKQIKGKKGENGRGKNQHGASSEDVIVKVPQGTVITDLDSGLILGDLTEKDASVVVAKGVEEVVEIRLLKPMRIRLLSFQKMENQAKREC